MKWMFDFQHSGDSEKRNYFGCANLGVKGGGQFD
jgi:hypothetical protein